MQVWRWTCVRVLASSCEIEIKLKNGNVDENGENRSRSARRIPLFRVLKLRLCELLKRCFSLHAKNPLSYESPVFSLIFMKQFKTTFLN